MPCGLQLTGGYRPKLNVATKREMYCWLFATETLENIRVKAGMFTPFLGTQKAMKYPCVLVQYPAG